MEFKLLESKEIRMVESLVNLGYTIPKNYVKFDALEPTYASSFSDIPISCFVWNTSFTLIIVNQVRITSDVKFKISKCAVRFVESAEHCREVE